MKKLLFVLAILFSLNVSANAVRTWKCNDIIVTYFENNTMQVGELLYDISFQGDFMVLHVSGKGMLLVSKGMHGSIIITNVDNRQDKKTFIKCN